ncbi:hypothetical protein ACFQY5_41125 [Paeniroseomonas aquatica]|uniref:alginate O-acetyltransferase AlgX-related protein n=1 Tax=Paeniroseomonas aquatica TaxID=373043 RepID=UPI00360B7210
MNIVNKVLVGKDDWLFLTNASNRVIDQITGDYKIPENFRDKWKALFDLRKLKSQEMKFSYVYSIIPNKECVYSKELPANIKLSRHRPVFDVLAAAEGLAKTCYPLEILQEKMAYEDVYIRGDTHWNHRGAFYAYQEILNCAGVQCIDESALKFENVQIDGDLSSKLGFKTETVRGKILCPSFTCLENNNVPNIGHRVVYQNSKKGYLVVSFFEIHSQRICLRCMPKPSDV